MALYVSLALFQLTFLITLRKLVILNQNPPIKPTMSNPFDTRNFPPSEDDDEGIKSVEELIESEINATAVFSQFTQSN